MLVEIFKRYTYIFVIYIYACGLEAYVIAKPVSNQAISDCKLVNLSKKPAYNKLYDLIHTKLELNLDWEKQQLHGIATLQVKPHFYPQHELVLDIKSCNIQNVFLVYNMKKKQLPHTYNMRQLILKLDKTYTKEETITVEINYTTKSKSDIDESKKRLRLGGDQGLYFVNYNTLSNEKAQQLWTQGEPNNNSYWFPTIDAPNQRSTQEVYITVEENFKTISNGMLVYTTLNEDRTRTDYWRMDLPHPPYLFMLAVGEFVEVRDEWNDIPVSYCVDKAYEKNARNIFSNTIEMLDFFSEKLDYSYPWSKYSQIIAHDYFAEGMENTTAVILSEKIQRDDRSLLDRPDQEQVIAHELFHHWFGNLVTCESWGQVAVNESLATFGSHIWYAHKYGPHDRDRLILKSIENYTREANFKKKNIIRNNYENPIEMFDSHTYNKGALVLHMLQTYLGEEAFCESLSQYLKKYAFSSTDIHQLRKTFEEVSGQDLDWFFNQWFFAIGHPMLRVENTYADNKITLKVWQKQSSTTYRLPLAIDVWNQGKKERHYVTVDKSYQEFVWDSRKQPEAIYIDKNYLLVGEIEYLQSPQVYKYLYNHAEDFFMKYEAIKYFSTANNIDQDTYYNFFKEVLQDNYWMFKILAIEAFEGYKKQEYYATIEKKLILLTHDGSSLVRKAALKVLSSLLSPNKYTSIYTKCLEDSSYQVVSCALHAYITYSEDSENIKDSVLSSFEDEEDEDIIITLSTYYTNTRKSDKYEWLKNKTRKLYTRSGYECLLNYLVEYVMHTQVPSHQEETVDFLKKILKQTTTPRIITVVYDALKKMSKQKKAKNLLKELKLT